MEILHGRRVQIVYCWDVEMINANFLQEANDRLDAKIWHATSLAKGRRSNRLAAKRLMGSPGTGVWI